MNSSYSPAALLGPYELLLPLSESGPSQAWVARLVGTGGFRAHVALKVIPRACFDDMPTEQLLLEQAALAAQVRHPNLAQVLDLGEQDDTLYVATEWVDGEPLKTLLGAGSGRMPLSIAINLIGQLCRGLQAIHELRNEDGALVGAVHGHVSLQNLLISYNGTVKLSDFGIARVMDRLSFLSGADEHNHKLTFAAPEQLAGGVVDRRSDVFGVGTLLYLLTTSHHPFQGADVRATLHNICSNMPAPAATSVVEDYPEELSKVVTRALHKSSDARFQSAAELLAALELAMPECFHTSCDQALACYVSDLCAARRLELQARMHAAELRHNRVRESMPVGRPSLRTSLRAVAIDRAETAPFERRSGSLHAATLGARDFYQANLRRFVPLALALPALFLIGLGLWRGLGAQSEPNPHSALGDEVTTLPEISVRSLPVSTPKATARAVGAPKPATTALPTPLAASATTALPVTPISSLPLLAHAAPTRSYRLPSAAPAKVPAASASSPTRPAAAVEPAPQPVNPWDPATFGPRH